MCSPGTPERDVLDVSSLSKTVVAAIEYTSIMLRGGFCNKDRLVNKNVQRLVKKKSKPVSNFSFFF